jgi:hypothetical protein
MATVSIHAQHMVVKVYRYPSLGNEYWAVTLVDDGKDRLSLIYETPEAASQMAFAILGGLADIADFSIAVPA